MDNSKPRQSAIDRGSIRLTFMLLLGIVVLAIGYFTANRLAFYAGILVTLCGVLIGIQRLIVRGDPSQREHRK